MFTAYGMGYARGRACGLDVGAARVGVAVEDELGLMAHPRGHLAARPKGDFLRSVEKLVRDENIIHLVVGLPLDMKGGEGESARTVRALARELADRTGCTVTLWDERLTTAQAKRSLSASGARVRKSKGELDAQAAVHILQSWLDTRPA